jgi:hypothetical protein
VPQEAGPSLSILPLVPGYSEDVWRCIGSDVYEHPAGAQLVCAPAPANDSSEVHISTVTHDSGLRKEIDLEILRDLEDVTPATN